MGRRTLKYIRVTLALAVTAILTFFFLDFAGTAPAWAAGIAKLQFVPAVLSLSLGIVLGLVVLTLLLGRAYCSVLCPLGTFQDVARRCGNLFRKKRKRYKYQRPQTILRWAVVAAITIAAVSGFIVLLGLLDPYSIYGRMVANIFRPAYLTVNNWLASYFSARGNYRFYYMDAGIVAVSALVVSVVSFLALGYMGWRHGRTYCNTVCPVGTVLGLASRFSLWKVRIDKDKCTKCGACAARCKASCIDAKGKTVDNSRCVTCYNCLDTCKFDALSYSLPRRKNSPAAEAAPACDTPKDESRRRFIATSIVATAATAKLLAQDRIDNLMITGTSVKSYKRQNPVSPPGARSTDRLLGKCTSCHLCVSKCPSHIIKPSLTEYGLSGFMIPTVTYEKGYCSYDCTVCTDVCPNNALSKLTVEEKNYTQIGHVVLVEDNCVVHTSGTSCGACAEHCPTQAVTMVPFRGGLTKPQIDTSICVGCGGCEFICPVRPFRAIYVEGNPVHTRRAEFEDAEKVELELDGFGF